MPPIPSPRGPLIREPRMRTKPARPRKQVLADLGRDRAVLAALPVNDPRRPLLRRRIDALLDELLQLAKATTPGGTTNA